MLAAIERKHMKSRRRSRLSSDLTTIRRKLVSPISVFILGMLETKEMQGVALLARIQLDDELFVHDRLHLFARRDVSDFALERVAIDR
jgi:hypothetical protein